MDRTPHGARAAMFAGSAFAILSVLSDASAYGPVGDPSEGSRGPHGIYANRAPHLFGHNVGLVQVEVTNLGFLGNPLDDGFNFGWRGGEYLHVAGLWVGAIAADNVPHVSTATPDAYDEFRPGLDAAATVYRSYEGAFGGDRRGITGRGDDDGDGRADEDFLNGRDDDGDGRVDEDYEAISQQMLVCEYSDDTIEAREQSPEHRPLHLGVRQRTFAWSTADANEFIGIEYTITNTGAERLRDVYLGFFVDADAGPKSRGGFYSDDAAGIARIDTVVVDPLGTGPCASMQVRLEMPYLSDVPDDGARHHGGDVPGYIGSLILGHTVDAHGARAPTSVGVRAIAQFSGEEPYPLGDPDTDLERYDLLSGEVVPNRHGVMQAHDYRWVMSAGPFPELPPDSSIVLQACLVVGDGYHGLVRNAVLAKRVFDGAHMDLDGDRLTGVNGRETCLTALPDGTPYVWRNPCDPGGPPRRFAGTACDPSAYVDNDCNRCTGVYGRESPVRWIAAVTLPPPETNVDPAARASAALVGDRSVTLLWDNVSELRADPALGKIVFEGYRLWRADG